MHCAFEFILRSAPRTRPLMLRISAVLPADYSIPSRCRQLLVVAASRRLSTESMCTESIWIHLAWLLPSQKALGRSSVLQSCQPEQVRRNRCRGRRR